MTTQFDSSLAGQRQTRIQKAQELNNLGINPYPNKADAYTHIADLKNNYAEHADKDFVVVGRLMSWREHGHLQFADLQDSTGRIQLYIKDDVIAATSAVNQTLGWEHLNLLDVGDHVQAVGTLTTTQRGEVSILVKELKILSKSIRPLPSKWHGITDVEERFRRRYLDMTMNPEIRERFVRRSKFWTAIRNFLNREGFVEVNVPVLEHVTGGADASPFVTHFDALDQDFYLRISHELPLKRLIGAGFEKVYDLGPRFRNEGFSDEHLPEHIAMEWYWAYANYEDGMTLTQRMFQEVMQEVYGTTKFQIRGFDVDLAGEWPRIDYCTIIKERYGVDVFETPVAKIVEILRENGVNLDGEVNRNRAVDSLWKLIRRTIGGPAFLVNTPKFMSPLAKSDLHNPELTQRFHPLIAGSEVANAYSELNDPVDQLHRFVEQQRLRDAGDAEAQMLDIDFVEMLEYGMPPTVGFGLSERVFWFFENVTAKEGVPFPALKHELDQTTREIYADIADLLPQPESKEVKTVAKIDAAAPILPQANIVVGKILTIEKHANADRLQVCQVAVGEGKQLQIVTAATNIAVGNLVPIALPEATIYSPKEEKRVKFKPRELRGVMSEGMMLSETELELGQSHEGILILDGGEVGTEVKL
jgi:lysyl-tRNA synthetase class 2